MYHSTFPVTVTRVWSTSDIIFDIGIPNLVCGYIFGSHTVSGTGSLLPLPLASVIEKLCPERILYII